MAERKGIITMKGNPMTLVGNEIKVGSVAPDFDVIDTTSTPFKFSSLKGKIVLISSVPSLDTPTCDLQTKRFHKEASKIGETVSILTISMDLPFAQKRWCGAIGVDKMKVLSDHRDASFGMQWGVLIKELRLLTRAIFIVDQKGIVKYIQIVKEVASEPNYQEALETLKNYQ